MSMHSVLSGESEPLTAAVDRLNVAAGEREAGRIAKVVGDMIVLDAKSDIVNFEVGDTISSAFGSSDRVARVRKLDRDRGRIMVCDPWPHIAFPPGSLLFLVPRESWPTVFAEPEEVMRERVREAVETTGREVTFIAAKVRANADNVEVLHCKVQLEGGGDFEIRRKASCDPSTPWVDPAALEWM